MAKKINKPMLRQNTFGGWEVIDAEPDIPDYVKEGNERYRGEPYPEPQKTKRQLTTRATIHSVTTEQENTVAKSAKNPDKPLFREGTKRYICYQALLRERGCTLSEGEDLLGWPRPTVRGQFDECAKLSGMKLEKTKEDNEYVYRLV
jgi:hypothetical protein